MSRDKSADKAKTFSFKEDFREIAFLFCVVAAYFLPVLIRGNSRVLSAAGTDIWNQYFYWRHFGFTHLASGEMPLWNPYIFSGTPYVAGVQSALFYPLNVLYLVFDTPFAINLSITIHCFLAGLFTYLFARSIDIGRSGAVLAALTFSYGAAYFFHVYPGHLSNLCTMVWLPLILIPLEQLAKTKEMKYAVWGSIALAIQFLAGHPQYFFYSTITVSLYFVLRVSLAEKRKKLYGLVPYGVFAAIAVLLTTIQLLPTLELFKYSVREGLTYEWTSAFSLPPWNLVTLLLPDLFGDMVEIPYWGKNYLWEMSLYLGIVPLVMCVIAIVFDRGRYVFILTVLAGVSLLFAFGKYTPLGIFLYDYVPGFNSFRGAAKFVFVFSFAMAVIAGKGMQRVTVLAEEGSPKLRYFSYGLVTGALLLFLLGAVGWFFGENVWRSMVEASLTGPDRYDPPPALTEVLLRSSMKLALWDILKACLILLLLGALLFVFAISKKVRAESLKILIIALTATDLAQFGSRYVTTFDPKKVYMDSDLKSFFKLEREPFRVATPIAELLNQGMLEGIANVGGYDAIVLRNYNELMNFAQKLPVDQPSLVTRVQAISPVLNLLNVKYYIFDRSVDIQVPQIELVFQGRRYNVYRSTAAYPRTFVVHEVQMINDRDAAFRLIESAGSALRFFAIVEEPIEGLPHHTSAQSPLPRIIERSLNRVTIQAQLEEQGFLVLADSYYPGWNAFVDGEKTKIYRANYVMRGVLVPAGLHRVEFRYDPLSFKTGLSITLATLAGVVGFLIWCRSRID